MRARPGIHEGLESLRRVKDGTGMPSSRTCIFRNNVPTPQKSSMTLQIPAFLCRQTDLLIAAGKTGKAVNVKKGQWLQPEGMRGAVAKVRGARTTDSELAVTERGTFFGYGDLVVDMRALRACETPPKLPSSSTRLTVCNALDLAKADRVAERVRFIPVLAMAAIAAGANGIFIETHPDPDNAPSDGPNMLPLRDLEALLNRLVSLWENVNR